MRLLLDTHTFIWFVMGNPRISDNSRFLIADNRNEKFLSIASVWEMAIKHSIGKLSFSRPFREFVDMQLQINNIKLLAINVNHVEVVSSLPLHHRDPFDRIIIAQGIVEKLPVVSEDSFFDLYPIQKLW